MYAIAFIEKAVKLRRSGRGYKARELGQTKVFTEETEIK